MKINRLVTAFICCLLFHTLNAQIIGSKNDIYIGYGAGKFMGDEIFREKGFYSPSLYANYEKMTCLAVKGLLLMKIHFNFGVSLNYYKSSQWKLESYTNYVNSEASQYAFSPLIQLHSKAAEYGFLNRTVFYLEAAPTIGVSAVTVQDHLFDVENQGTPVQLPARENDIFFGLRGAAGVNLYINQLLGLFLESGAGYYHVNPEMYADTRLMNFYISGGLIVKLVKDKRFYY